MKLTITAISLVVGFMSHWIISLASKLAVDPTYHYAPGIIIAIVVASWFAMAWSADSMDHADKEFERSLIPLDMEAWLESQDPTGQYDCMDDWLNAYASETGADMELDFDPEAFQERQYGNYVRKFMRSTYGV